MRPATSWLRTARTTPCASSPRPWTLTSKGFHLTPIVQNGRGQHASNGERGFADGQGEAARFQMVWVWRWRPTTRPQRRGGGSSQTLPSPGVRSMPTRQRVMPEPRHSPSPPASPPLVERMLVMAG
jgi:hypothetical protein